MAGAAYLYLQIVASVTQHTGGNPSCIKEAHHTYEHSDSGGFANLAEVSKNEIYKVTEFKSKSELNFEQF